MTFQPTPSPALVKLLQDKSVPVVIFDPRVLVGAMVAGHATAPDERFVNAATLYQSMAQGRFLHCNSEPLMKMFCELAQNPDKLRRLPSSETAPHHGLIQPEAEVADLDDDVDGIWTAPIPHVPVRETFSFIKAAHDLTFPVDTEKNDASLAGLSTKGRELAKVALSVCDTFRLAKSRPVYLVTGELSVRRFSPETTPFKVVRPAELVQLMRL